MRILYGVVGEGMGHATRSKVTCEHLVERGHEVKIVVSGRAHGFLAKSFPDVVEIKGLTIRYVDNRMDRDGTLAKNLVAAPSIVGENIAKYYDDVVGYEPDLVISDFDSFAYLFAKRHGLPIISIDNQQIISRCKHDAAIKKGVKVDYQMTKAFVRAKLPGCDHYVITTFFYPPIRKKFRDDTTLVPPILRRAILEAKPRASVGEHVLVYQTSASDAALLPALAELREHRFVVYGLKRNDQKKKSQKKSGPPSAERFGNCLVKDFSEEGFVHDLATAKAVVCNGGLSLIGEALYLGKPIFSVPVKNQFEQVMNARYLEELGYGLAAAEIDPQLLRLFLNERDRYAARIAKHKQNGNEELFRAVDALVQKLGKKGKKRRLRQQATAG
ncbi:MAG TPA: MJ1255/VC2487 family glycosyltransferase [Polyangiaceae bacterium]|nr:MJ1255/VC2487 family glycosyltransferase [Polyangiaceae bacterium]